MRGECTCVDDATHETTKGAAKTLTIGKLPGHDQSDRPVGPAQSGLEQRSNSRSVAA